MKKFILIFILVMVALLGLFFWSFLEKDEETEESGTLVTAPLRKVCDVCLK